jgi:hypothetical protein
LAQAFMVSSRLWLGEVVGERRDFGLIPHSGHFCRTGRTGP